MFKLTNKFRDVPISKIYLNIFNLNIFKYIYI